MFDIAATAHALGKKNLNGIGCGRISNKHSRRL